MEKFNSSSQYQTYSKHPIYKDESIIKRWPRKSQAKIDFSSPWLFGSKYHKLKPFQRFFSQLKLSSPVSPTSPKFYFPSYINYIKSVTPYRGCATPLAVWLRKFSSKLITWSVFVTFRGANQVTKPWKSSPRPIEINSRVIKSGIRQLGFRRSAIASVSLGEKFCEKIREIFLFPKIKEDR